MSHYSSRVSGKSSQLITASSPLVNSRYKEQLEIQSLVEHIAGPDNIWLLLTKKTKIMVAEYTTRILCHLCKIDVLGGNSISVKGRKRMANSKAWNQIWLMFAKLPQGMWQASDNK